MVECWSSIQRLWVKILTGASTVSQEHILLHFLKDEHFINTYLHTRCIKVLNVVKMWFKRVDKNIHWAPILENMILLKLDTHPLIRHCLKDRQSYQCNSIWNNWFHRHFMRNQYICTESLPGSPGVASNFIQWRLCRKMSVPCTLWTSSTEIQYYAIYHGKANPS